MCNCTKTYVVSNADWACEVNYCLSPLSERGQARVITYMRHTGRLMIFNVFSYGLNRQCTANAQIWPLCYETISIIC